MTAGRGILLWHDYMNYFCCFQVCICQALSIPRCQAGRKLGVCNFGWTCQGGSRKRLHFCHRCLDLAWLIQLTVVCTWNCKIKIHIWDTTYIFREQKMMAPTYQELSAEQVLVLNAVIQVQKVQVQKLQVITLSSAFCANVVLVLPACEITMFPLWYVLSAKNVPANRSQRQATEKAWLFVLLPALLLVSPRQWGRSLQPTTLVKGWLW